jgi:hypothetical protein
MRGVEKARGEAWRRERKGGEGRGGEARLGEARHGKKSLTAVA